MPVLTGVDLVGIQDYIFGSNRLRDAVAGSRMVADATSQPVLAQWGVSKGAVLLAAGGNAIVRFDSLSAARRWAADYTRWLLDAAPGLDAVVAHQGYERLAQGLRDLGGSLDRAKAERRPSVPLLGLSFTERCVITGLPAVAHGEDGPISARIQRARDRLEEPRGYWTQFLPADTTFPIELDKMGRTRGDTSLVGVVHVDGNGVGQAIRDWLDRSGSCDDEQVWREYREWSEGLCEQGEKVLRTLVQRAAGAIAKDGSCGEPALGLKLSTQGGDWVLPLAPVLLGGDDLTFVCDGRIALDLAATAVEALSTSPVKHLGAVSACAGVLLAKAHAPFHQSYAMAESLCRSAKRARTMGGSQEGWLDWHFGGGRPGESAEELRMRAYPGDQTDRPYALSGWKELEGNVLAKFRAAPWSERRSRVKALGRILAEDDWETAKRQIEAWQVNTPGLQAPADLRQRGRLLDAIELLDLHAVLKPAKAMGAAS